MINKRIRNSFAFLLLVPITMLLVYVSIKMPLLVEKTYSGSIYPQIGQILSRATGAFPFSLAELIVILFPLTIAAYTLITAMRLFSRKSIDTQPLLDYFLNMAAIASIAFFSFVVLWGLNYYRLPFAAIAGLEVRPSTVQELEKVCEALIDRANTLRTSVNTDSDGMVDIQESSRHILKNCYKGYEAISGKYPFLGGNYGSPKPILLSELMNYTGICGVYFPFTAEANVNVAIPEMMLPSTAAHEMAHQRGFSREDEANYISYLACTAHPDINYKYSGIILALTNAMNALYRSDREIYWELVKNYSSDVRHDLTSLNEFWKRYEGPVEKTSEKINNTYLKANNQKDGVQSYGRMVDLLLAEYRSAH